MTNRRFPLLDRRNYMGKLKPSSSRRRRLSFEQLECRRLLATVQWDGGGNGTAWSDPLNWVGDSLPTAADDAIINVPLSNPVITVTGNNTVKSLVTSEVITFNVGTFTTPSIQLNAIGSIAGATIVGANFSGSGTLQVTSASGTLNGVTLGVNTTLREGASGSGNQVTALNGLTLAGGSVLRLERPTNYNGDTVDVGLNFAGGDSVLGGTGVVELFSNYNPASFGGQAAGENDVRVRSTAGKI